MNQTCNRDPKDIIWKATFNDGYSFKCLFNVIAIEIEKTVMVITPNTFSIDFQNSKQNIIHNIKIYTKNIREYKYDHKDINGNIIPQIIIGFETKSVFNALKGIGRNDSFEFIYRREGTSLEIRPVGISNSGKNSSFRIQIQQVDQQSIIPDEMIKYPKEPNVKLLPKELGSMLQKCVAAKSDSVSFTIFRNGFVAHGYASGGIEVYKSEHGFNEKLTGEVPDYERLTYNVPIINVKALIKFTTVSLKNSVLKFYFANSIKPGWSSPIKIKAIVGPSCGKYSMYISNRQKQI